MEILNDKQVLVQILGGAIVLLSVLCAILMVINRKRFLPIVELIMSVAATLGIVAGVISEWYAAAVLCLIGALCFVHHKMKMNR